MIEMFIRFSYDPTYDSYLVLPTEQKIPLVQAVPLLASASEELEIAETSVTIDYFLYSSQDQEQPLLQANLKLPIIDIPVVEALQKPVLESDDYTEEQKEDFLELFGKKKRKIAPRSKSAKNKPLNESKQIKQEKKTVKRPLIYLGVGLILLSLVCTFFLGQATTQSAVSTEDIKPLEKRLDEVEGQADKERKIDTFSRFFLANYLSIGTNDVQFREQVEKYVEKELLNDLTPTEIRAKSILPWEVKQKNNQWTVAYVITTEDTNKKTTTEKISFELVENEQTFLVHSVPKRESFSIN